MTSVVKPWLTEHKQMRQTCLRQGPEDTEGIIITDILLEKKSHRREPSNLVFVLGQWGWSGNKHPAELFTHGSSLALITCSSASAFSGTDLQQSTDNGNRFFSFSVPVYFLWSRMTAFVMQRQQNKRVLGFVCAQKASLEKYGGHIKCKFAALYSEWFIPVALNVSQSCSIKR